MEATRCLLLAAGPTAPGAKEFVNAALDTTAVVDVILAGGGLAWAEDPTLQSAQAGGRVVVSLCTVSAREQGWRPEQAPPWIAWSGVAVWLLRHIACPQTWTLVP